ncbi:MAG TPA: hypothetical protein PKJ37_11360 [Acidobacteriota bacterium]|nr:hypothetical protein [Acidobacteriota bacterium]HNT18475.1 hypothetical protein [Acidobacteriota bacterium]
MRSIKGLCLLLVLLISFLLMCLNFASDPQLGDEGVLAMDGWRILRGEVPHRDFFQGFPPLAAYVQALSFRILSPSVLSVRLLGFFYGIILISAALFFFRSFISDKLVMAAALSIIVPAGFGNWMFGSHHWLCAILQLSGAILLLASLRKGSLGLSACSGMALGLAVFTLQDQGGYAVIGLLAVSAVVPGENRKLFVTASLSAIASFLALSAFLALYAGPGQLFFDWVYFPLFFYKQLHKADAGAVLGYFTDEWNWSYVSRAPLYAVGSALKNDFMMVSPLLALLSLAWLWVKKARPREELAVLTVFPAAFFLGALHRFSPTNLVWGFPLTLPFFALMDHFCSKAGKWKQAALASSAFLMMVFFAISLGEAHIISSSSYPKYEIESRAGRYSTMDGRKAESVNGILDEIDRRVPEGEPMFCVGYVPLVNFLSGRPNPTRFNFFHFGVFFSPGQTISFRESLEQGKVSWGVSLRENMNERNGGSILPGFRPVFANEMFVLWEKKNAASQVRKSFSDDGRVGVPGNE